MVDPATVAAGDAALGEHAELYASAFAEGAGPALTTVLNRSVTVDLLDVAAVAPGRLGEIVEPPAVVIGLTYQRSLSGAHWLVVPGAAAMALARAANGDEGDADDLTNAEIDALRDAVNQMLAAASPALLPLAGRPVTFAPVTVRAVESAEALPAEFVRESGATWVARLHVYGGGLDVRLALTIGADVARALVTATTGAPEPEPDRPSAAAPGRLDLILDVTLPVTVELGRARMQIQDVLKLAPGSVIELDKSAGDPVELYINDRPIAKGEVVIIDENFGVRLTSIVTATERIKTLR
jgi:flagellar motor switch protein FliN/FliY